MSAKSARGLFPIILAAVMWGTMSLFVRTLAAMGFTSMQIAALRLGVAGPLFFILLFIMRREEARVGLRDILYFVLTGVVTIALMVATYYKALTIMPVSVCEILLYAAPVWVELFDMIFRHKKPALMRTGAIGLAFAGCVLISVQKGGGITAGGLALAVLSGICYAAYTMMSAKALRRYSAYTVTAYSFTAAGICVLLAAGPADIAHKCASLAGTSALIPLVLGLAVITTVAPFLLYNIGLKTVDSARASALTTIDPVIGSIIGACVFSERIRPLAVAGLAVILIAVVILCLPEKKLK